MKNNSIHIFILIAICCNSICSLAVGHTMNMVKEKPMLLVVDAAGKGNFSSIQEAINSLPDLATKPRIIFIKKGVYKEKIFIEKNFISLVGEDKTNTIIQISLARDIWRCENKDDWGAATINLKGNDLVLQNLTITNQFGLDNINRKEGIPIDCPGDSLQHYITIQKDGHQMALRSFNTTRLIVRNCTLLAYGGDTVSPWNTEDGMFYFTNCTMEGGVDFYCPRGWAYAENCTFIAHGNVAAIWHDGSKYKSSKSVLNHCIFNGDDGFKLGRYHRDAQFYLLNCSFSSNMSNTPIYLNPSKPQNIIQWGERVYFFNCHKEGGDYSWHADNLLRAPDSPDASQINAAWTFAGKWSPEQTPINIDASAMVVAITDKENHPSFSETDPIAENMLVYQRAIGGWPKAVNEVKVDYTKSLSETEKRAIIADSLHIDATIDNNATTKEIRYLVKAYKKTNNNAYLKAAKKGIHYYLIAQYANGGWPQYFPDSALYRSQITYNDDAMVNVLNVLADIVERKNDFDLIPLNEFPQIPDAISRGIQCIIRTQIRVNDTLTAWCAQYNHRTFQPEMARKFELVSISGNESVGIIRFLMRINNPPDAIIQSITAAIQWLEKVKITGYKYTDILSPNEPSGKDRVIVPDSSSTLWARFYEIGTNRPFFSGRNSIKKYNLKEIEAERRNGYGWYGTWPQKLLSVEYPQWAKKNLK